MTPHSPGLTVWLSTSLLTGIQPSALPERVPRGKAEALSMVPATWLWEPRPPLPFLPLLASEKLWFVQEALSSESDAGEAGLPRADGLGFCCGQCALLWKYLEPAQPHPYTRHHRGPLLGLLTTPAKAAGGTEPRGRGTEIVHSQPACHIQRTWWETNSGVWDDASSRILRLFAACPRRG